MGLATLADNIGAVLSGGKPSVGENWLARAQAAQDYDQNLPAMRAKAENESYDQYLRQSEAGQNVIKSGVETQNLQQNSPAAQKKAQFINQLQTEAESGKWSPDALRARALRIAQYNNVNVAPEEIDSLLSGTKPIGPAFKVKDEGGTPISIERRDGTILPVNSPSLTDEEKQVVSQYGDVARNKEALKNDPIVLAQLGAPPTDPAALKAWGQKAEAIKTRMSAAPRVEMTLARPVQVADPVTGEVTYTPAGEAMKSGAMAPGSIPFKTAAAVTKEFTTGGAAKNLNAFNTAIEHAAQLDKAIDALGNGNATPFNEVANLYGAKLGQDPTTNYNVIKNALVGEISKVFKGGGATDAEIESVQGPFNAANSPAQLKGAIKQAVALMNSKREALKSQYESGMQGKPAFGSPSALKVGQQVKLKSGKTVTVTAVHDDGSFDY
jgi:hypothetical protein